MSSALRVIKSTDAGAPALTGQAGSLSALLDAVLVNGFGVGEAAIAPLGWSLEFSGINVRAYRNDPVEGSGSYLRVDDSATTGNGRHSWFRAYELMSDIDTGSGITPTAAQRASGVLIPKSKTLDGTSRAWRIIGNETCFYLFINAASVRYQNPHFVGDLEAINSSDSYTFALSDTPLTSWSGDGGQMTLFSCDMYYSSQSGPLYACRNFSGSSRAVICYTISGMFSRQSYLGNSSGSVEYPCPTIGGAIVGRPIITDGGLPRAWLPGLYSHAHGPTYFADGAMLETVVGLPANLKLMAINWQYHLGSESTSFNGQVLFNLGASD